MWGGGRLSLCGVKKDLSLLGLKNDLVAGCAREEPIYSAKVLKPENHAPALLY